MTHITITTLEQFKAEYNNIKVNSEAGNEIKLYVAEDVLVADGVMHRLSQLNDNVTVTKLENKQEEEETVETVEGVVVEEAVAEEDKKIKQKNKILRFVFGKYATGDNGEKLVSDEEVAAQEAKDKEERKMKFNIKDNSFVQTIKKAATSMWSFVKKHAVQAVAGLGAVALAGTFTTGLGMATLVGAAIYTVGDYAYNAFIKKDASVFSSLVQSALYTSVGAYLAYSLFYAVAVVGLYASQYTALGFVYAQYFILA